MPNFSEILSNYFYELQIPEKYISNYSQIFHKFQNKFSQIVVGPTFPTLSLLFRSLRTSLPFPSVECAHKQSPEKKKQRWSGLEAALHVSLLVAGRRPSSSPVTGPGPRPLGRTPAMAGAASSKAGRTCCLAGPRWLRVPRLFVGRAPC